MALRDQPYLPLYVQDFLTDEKLRECSAGSVGVYIMTMCLMHKSSEYGTILLGQKDKQSSDGCVNFANKLTKHLPFPSDIILNSLRELINEGVLTIDGDKLMQLRMVKDNGISLKRAKAGSKGYFAKAKVEANVVANTENENENENESKSVLTNTNSSGEKQILTQVEIYFQDLPNSQQFESIVRDSKADINSLMNYIPEFKKRTKSRYKDFYDFVDHFKFSYLKQLSEKTPITETIKAPSSFKPFKKP